MARTGFFHHIGTLLLFAAGILLLVTSISAPVVGDIAILKVTLTNFTDIRNSSVTFGTFGYCVLDVPPIQTDQDWCSSKSIGYEPATIMASIDGTAFSTASADTANTLTKAMVLHPITCGLAFIAFMLALGSGICGSLLAACVSAVAWLFSVVVLAVDFAAFDIIKKNVNSDGTGSQASYSTGMWTMLAAMLCLFFGTFVILFTCCSARLHRRSDRGAKMDPEYAPPMAGSRF